MNTQPILTEASLEAMLTRWAGHGTPSDLADAIAKAVAATPQARAPLWRVLLPHPRRAPAVRLAWVVALIGLLLAAVLSVVLMGGELLQRVNDLVVVPVPTVQPAPVATPTTAPADQVGRVATRPVDQVRALAFAPDGSAWLATGGGVVHWDVARETATLYGQADGLPATSVERLVVAPDGTVWAAGENWLARFDGSWTTLREPIGLSLTGIGSMTIDRDGSLWVAVNATEGPRLLRIGAAVDAMTVPEGVHGYANPWGLKLRAGADGSVWVAAADGLARFDGSDWTVHAKVRDELPRAPSLAGVTADGIVWVTLDGEGCVLTSTDVVSCATPAAGVASYDGTRWTVYTTADGLPDNEVHLAIGSDGSVWATRGSGVLRFDGSGWVTTEVPALEDAYPAAVTPDGALWLISPDGVLRYDGDEASRPAMPAIEPPAEVPPLTLAPVTGSEATVTTSALGTVTWRTYEASPEHNVWTITGTPFGPVAIDGSDLRWLTADGSWAGASLPIEPWGVTAVGNDLVVTGRGAARLSWNGTRWIVGEQLDTGLASVDQVVFGPRGAIMTGRTSMERSADGIHFVPVQHGPDTASLAQDWTESDEPIGCLAAGGVRWFGEGKIGPVLATEAGFVALTPAHPANWNYTTLCEPVPWFSADGSTWDLVSTESPFGDRATVTSVASRGGRHVAVGTVGAFMTVTDPPSWRVWVSDDGLDWELLPTLERAGPCIPLGSSGPCSDFLGTVVTSESGWLIVGWDGSTWTSTDGRAWEPLRDWPAIRGGYMPPAVALSPGSIVVAGSLPGSWHDAVAVGTIVP